MTINLQEHLVRTVCRHLHEKGIEPGIDADGFIEIDRPADMTDDAFADLKTEIADLVERASKDYRSG